MPSVNVEGPDGSRRVYIRPGAKAKSIPTGNTVTQVGRGVIQKSGGKVVSPPTGKRRK